MNNREKIMDVIDSKIEEIMQEGNAVSITELALIGIFTALEDMARHGLRTYEQCETTIAGTYQKPIHVLVDNTGDFIQ